MSDLMKFLVVGNQSFEVCDAAARAGIGSPLMAETVAEMTDTDKVYVYVGDETGYENGHWYYYDGSDWQDGGIYNSAAIQLDTTLSVPGEAADAKAVGDALAEKANIDGEYESMTVGNAEQLVATVGENNKTPYSFRTSGGSIDIGDREVDKLVGGTVAFNQLINITATQSTINDVEFTPNADGSVTVDGEASDNTAYNLTAENVNLISGHKYYLAGGVNNNLFIDNTITSSVLSKKPYSILECSASTSIARFRIRVVNGYDCDNVKIYPQLIDLTQMFGSTIADYIYSLEQATAGAGVAYFRKLFPNNYYAYNAGELMSVKTSAHVMTGFNQWDEEWEIANLVDATGEVTTGNKLVSKNYIHCLPNTAYYKHGTTSYGWCLFYYYDANKNYIGHDLQWTNDSVFTTPANCYFMKFKTYNNQTTYNNDICINLHWDGERDGEYEPYVKHEYALDSNLELRGIPKLDANNQLYYDGDTYESDGTVTRNYEYRAYASGDESLPDTITDGTHTVTKLTTPTTETADTYQNPQIVDDWGTEEYVDSRTVAIPVGHDTMYQANLRAKLEMMPNLPEVNGDYLLRQSASGAEYVAHTSPIPTLPSEDGTYVLKCTVADGTAILTWEAQS